MVKGKTYKVCSTCINFEIVNTQSGNKFRCRRLGFETVPSYSFHCWNPKPKVKSLMERRQKEGKE